LIDRPSLESVEDSISGIALLLSGLCALLCLNIGFARLLLTSISELTSEMIIVFLGLAIAVTAIID
jgi:hypothetical protein